MSQWLQFFFGRKEGASFHEDRLREMVQAVEGIAIPQLLPDLTGQLVLEIAPALAPMAPLLKSKGARLVADWGTSEGFSVKSRPGWIPFLDASLDCVLGRISFEKKEVPRLIPEMARVLKQGGCLILADLHPFSPPVQEEYLKNPVTPDGLAPGFERYYRFFKNGPLVLESVREYFFDGSLKKLFLEGEKGQYERVRKRPFMMMWTLRKDKEGGANEH